MIQQAELWWFGLGAIGSVLTLAIMSTVRRVEWRGSIPTAVGMSPLGPIMLIPALIYLVSPITVGLAIQAVLSDPDRPRSLASRIYAWMGPPAVLVLLAWTLVIAPLR